MAGLTDQGFQKKTRIEIEQNMKNRAKNLFGNSVNLSDNSPLGKIIKNTAYELAESWRSSEDVYNASFVDFASGVSLDYLCKLIGISRRPPNTAKGEQTFYGDNGTIIPEGFLVETEDEVRFYTTESGEIESEEVTLAIESVEGGLDKNIEAGFITEIVNPISGLDSTTNPTATEDGRDRESDFELRERFEQSVARGGASTIDAIAASLLQINGVIDALVEENNTMETIADGAERPPKSIECFVYGGQDADIAEVIFDTKPAGIESYGDVTVSVEDILGNTHDMSFTRPDFIDIWVEADITTNSEFPSDGNEQVQTEIIKYIGGTDADLVEYDGLALGEDVIRTKIIAAIHNIDGITDVDLQIGDSETSLATSNITIGAKEVAITDDTKVDVV